MPRITLPALTLSLVTLCGAAQAAAVAPAPVAGDVTFQELLDQRAPTIVSIKFILKGGDQDEEAETLGVVIEPDGLILASNIAFGGLNSRFGSPTQLPTDIKVMIGDDNQGVDGTFLARDSDLQLAWIKLKNEPAKPLASVDFTQGAKSQLGDSLYIVSQMGRFFGRVPSVSEGRVGAVTRKPRELLIPSAGLAGNEMGMPVFNNEGKPVGVTTFILPEQDEAQGSPGGVRAAMRGVMGAMVLPAAEVAAATARAKETADRGGGAEAVEAPPAGEAKKDDAPGKTEPEQPK